MQGFLLLHKHVQYVGIIYKSMDVRTIAKCWQNTTDTTAKALRFIQVTLLLFARKYKSNKDFYSCETLIMSLFNEILN